MNTMPFVKMVAAGNDFTIIENRYLTSATLNLSELAKTICDRRYGVGCDGMLILESSNKADIKMRIFNPDGSEARMCGNGARCTAKYFSHYLSTVSNQPITIETKAGRLEASVRADMVKVKMSDPRDLKLNLKLDKFLVHYIDTGVPHAVIFVADLDKIDIEKIGRQVRYHKEFSPQGANADFVRVLKKGNIAIRTYERGVEAETLACGTGCVASALIYIREAGLKDISAVRVLTKSQEVLKVSFDRKNGNFVNVFLEGTVRIVYQGRFNYGL